MGNEKWGRQVQDAIARRDAPALRLMATTAERKEISMWLALLARMIELDAARRRRHGQRSGRLAAQAPPARRVSALRRAG